MEKQQSKSYKISLLNEALLDLVPNPVFVKDKEGIYIECNKAFEDFIGLKRDKIIGKTAYDISPRSLADIYHKADQELIKYGGNQTYESKVLYSDGIEHDVLFRKSVFKDSKDNIMGIVGVMTDITDKKLANQALFQSEKRYRTLFDNAADPIFLHGFSGNFIDVNQLAIERFQFTKSEFLSMKPGDLGDPQTAMKRISQLQKTGHAIFETTLGKKDGSRVPVELNSKTIEYDEKPTIITIARDITERKETEKELKLSQETLAKKVNDLELLNKELNETQAQLIQSSKLTTIGQMAAEMAHEINNPLGSIKIDVEEIFSDIGKNEISEKEVKEALSNIITNTKKISGTINRLRVFTRKSDEAITKVDINQVIQATIDLMKKQFEVSDIAFTTNLSEEPLKCYVNKNQIEQAITNILLNAKDAVNSLDPKNKKVMISTKTHNQDQISISITDNGIGMDECSTQNIFQPFFTKKTTGVGLGMSIVKRIIDGHNAKIEVDSKPKKGTKITIIINREWTPFCYE